ncbi:MAG TPA: aminotransferase class I/II-fold pyridoxal phosphate-dependent enzyme [Chitinophagaceae bacterium]|nr:aminotransferase class I/II-fold pyridoxal phosphate-dependent enzyme [Chitinophagaceae bacterium]
MTNTIPRRAWLRQSSLALAGLTVAGRLSAAGSDQHKPFMPPGPIKLTSNENPYGPSPLARRAMADAIVASNRYPWDNTTVLRGHIGKANGLSADHVLMGAGSSEILGIVAQYAALNKGNVVTASLSFPTAANMSERFGMEIIRVPLTRDKKHDLPAMMSKINNNTRMVYVCNPNNPTSTIVPSADVKNFVEEASKKCIVLLDEAYIEYCNEPTLSSLVANNRNIIVAKTFSKIYGLAGARIGYALAHPDTIGKLGNFQPWQNAGASAVSVAGAIASLEDKDFIRSTKEMNSKARTYVINELTALGFECIPSETNFLFHTLGSYTGNWTDQMRAKNILTGRIVEGEGRWTRITIGTMEEMQAFVAAAKQIV